MSDITMSFDECMQKYLSYRKMSGMKSSVEKDLRYFQHACQRNFQSTDITQEMVDWWWKKKDTELPVSHRSRVYHAKQFLEYVVNQRNLVALKVPDVPEYVESNPNPHYFAEDELRNFFKACDEIVYSNTLQQKLRKIEVPVIFRLLYSSGIRVIEARLLDRKDVDFETGIVNIVKSKGYIEHRIVLHDTMLTLLKQYDEVVDAIMPDRKVMFPDVYDDYHKNKWLSDNFYACWYKYNTATAFARELRHNYAIENINSWNTDRDDINENLVALKNSMGHKKTSRTLYYYSLVPRYADIIEGQCGNTLESTIPKLKDYDESNEWK